MPDTKPLDGKIALITGGTRGIGRAVALKFGALGADVVVNYNRSAQDAANVVAELEALGVQGVAMQANVGDLDDVHRLFEDVKQRFGGLDILVNSAARGLQRPRSAITSLPNHLRQTFDMNVLGPWFASKEAAPLMESRGGGAIVNLTSLGARRYLNNYAAVGVTKGALDSLTMYLAVELAPKRIRVNGVCPSWVVETSGIEAMPGDVGAALLKNVPAGRHILPEDVANLVAFLAGPESEMIIGQTIVIDGGLSGVGVLS
jgi:enoyl-[acyl-carrier protein] reductase III